jgi:hypothetical protein
MARDIVHLHTIFFQLSFKRIDLLNEYILFFDLFLEDQLCQSTIENLKVLNLSHGCESSMEERKFPLIQMQCCLKIMCPITMMDMQRTTTPYSRIRLEPEISLLQGIKALPTSLIALCTSTMLLVRSPGLQNYPC